LDGLVFDLFDVEVVLGVQTSLSSGYAHRNFAGICKETRSMWCSWRGITSSSVACC